jgi:hypothetical protein
MKNTIELVTIEDFQDEIRPILKELADIKSYIGRVAPKQFYRNKDLKAIFGFSDNTILEYRSDNTIPYTKLGSIYYYPVAEINNILQQNSNFDLVKKGDCKNISYCA